MIGPYSTKLNNQVRLGIKLAGLYPRWDPGQFEEEVKRHLGHLRPKTKLQVQEMGRLAAGLTIGEPPAPVKVSFGKFMEQCGLPPRQTKALNCLDVHGGFEDDWR